MIPPIKCVVWDLDNTLWQGTIAEGDDVRASPQALDLVRRLERAGVVQSVASRNDPEHAGPILATIGLADIFVYPQVSWSAKSASVERIVRLLDIGTDTVVFLDDSPFERAEVTTSLPKVRAYSLPKFLALYAERGLLPNKVTSDAVRRPAAYREESCRKAAQAAFEGTAVEFLASLDLALTVRTASMDDLSRAAELTERTNQLNTTARTFSAAELAGYVSDPARMILMAELVDRFGDYGRVGLCLIRRHDTFWLIELMLMSCRVGGRNVGNAFVGVVAGLADAAGVPLRALYVPNSRNRQMRIMYAFNGFVEADGTDEMDRTDGAVVLEHLEPGRIPIPQYFTVVLSDDLIPDRTNRAHDLVQTPSGGSSA